MRRIAQRKQFRADFKHQKRRGKDLEELVATVQLLAEEGDLPAAYRAHKLTGEWSGVWECHIEPDWLLLIYTVNDEEVFLIRTGSHADLFM